MGFQRRQNRVMHMCWQGGQCNWQMLQISHKRKEFLVTFMDFFRVRLNQFMLQQWYQCHLFLVCFTFEVFPTRGDVRCGGVKTSPFFLLMQGLPRAFHIEPPQS